MTCTTPVAKSQMNAIAAAALAAFPGLVVQYTGVDALEPPDADKDWARVDIQHDGAGQGSLSGPVNGAVRWRRNGYIFVQCYGRLAPVGAAPGDLIGLDQAMAIACAVRDAFQGRATEGGVWFRKCEAKEVGPHLAWYQANAVIRFEYDEVK